MEALPDELAKICKSYLCDCKTDDTGRVIEYCECCVDPIHLFDQLTHNDEFYAMDRPYCSHCTTGENIYCQSSIVSDFVERWDTIRKNP
jgi:hypothetical protein